MSPFGAELLHRVSQRRHGHRGDAVEQRRPGCGWIGASTVASGPPTWPSSLFPQHQSEPSCFTAQVWLTPAATVLTPLLRPETATGVARLVVVPSPSWL